ncbi:unnamed protein product [Caenorhabditis angaria]|uniref:Sugar phosphate transporter domain-containing protein n=1 Tax=Caenorhabditis angaria TaxID=860376 RepID=A0A9P1N400_9PELO|nr:unnamed protein product [Caenorhabditis angaria]
MMRSLKTTSGRSLILFILASTFCSIMGKVIVTRFFFDYPIVILMMQTASTLFVIEISRILGILKVPPYSFEKGRQIFIPSLLYTLAQWVTVASFEGIAMPNFDSVKRFTPLLILIFISLRGRQQKLDPNRTLMILGLCFATSVAVNLELAMDRYSFLYGVFGAGLQAAALILFEENMVNFSATEMLYLHSFNSLVFYLMADIVQDEIRDAFMYIITAAHPLFIVVFLINLLAGIIFHFTIFKCLEHNGAVKLQIFSNIRCVFETFIAYYMGFYLFYDVSPGIINWLFLIFTCLGAKTLRFGDGIDFEKEKGNIVKGPWMTKA